MGKTSIEWTEKVWNPVRGCSRVSPGCQNCYAERQSARFTNPGQYAHGFTERTKSGPRWTGRVELIPEKLAEPLSWRKPAMVFVNSMSDLFHEKLSNEDIAAVFGVMAACPHLTFQVLTKRAERLPEFFAWCASPDRWTDGKGPEPLGAVLCEATAVLDQAMGGATVWPLPNVWLGVSVEDQQRADERIPHLLSVPAAIRFLSCEPLLGRLDIARYLGGATYRCSCGFHETENELIFMGGVNYFCATCNERCVISRPGIGWVICGGESGPGARPMQPEWARSLRDQCVTAGVPYFFKQWGAWAPDWEGAETCAGCGGEKWEHVDRDGECSNCGAASWSPAGRPLDGLQLVGKRAAGRELDGRTWDEMPEVSP